VENGSLFLFHMSQPDQEQVAVSDPTAAACDPELPFVRQALSAVHMKHLLMEKLHCSNGDASEMGLQAIRVMHHTPGQRCMLEYDVTDHRPDATEKTVTLVGTVHARVSRYSTYKTMKILWSAGFYTGSPDGIFIPEPVTEIPELNMYLQRKAPGKTATHLLAGQDGIVLAERIAQAAHKIHHSGVRRQRFHTIVDELDILRQRLHDTARQKPEWSNRLERLLAACLRLGVSIPAAPSCPIHRDFHPDRVLVDGERLYLLDFDLYAEGDPALDIGNFLGHMKEYSLRSTGDAQALADREAALTDRYIELNAGRWWPSALRQAVSAYTTLTLARHIDISRQFQERQPFSEALLELCEQRLGLAQTHSSPQAYHWR
jgi:thiamine kinase-like enzyme